MERERTHELTETPERFDGGDAALAELSEEELLMRLMTHLRELDPLHDLATSATAVAELAVAETAADSWRTFDQLEREAAERLTIRKADDDLPESEEPSTSTVADRKKPL